MFDDNKDICIKNKSKIFISLGNYCLTSMIFKDNNMKFESYPFDWMTSQIDNIIHIINDDFKDFLNKNNYTKIKHGTRNNVYYNNTNSLFNLKSRGFECDHEHHDLTKEKDYNYLTRCVERFNNLINIDKQKIFVMIQPLYISNLQVDDKLYNILFDTLFNKFGDNIKLLIFNITNINNEYYSEKKINDKCFIYELKSKILLGGYDMMWYDNEGIEQFLKLVNN
jgi:hypothetical protein